MSVNPRLVLAIATDCLAPSQYVNFDYSSVAALDDGVAVGFNEEGIFLLDSGDIDEGACGEEDPIQSIVRYARVDMGVLHRKRLRAIVVKGEAEGCLSFSLAGDERQMMLDATATPPSTTNQQTIIKAMVPRTFYGANIDLTIENVNGVDFSIDAVDIYWRPQVHRI